MRVRVGDDLATRNIFCQLSFRQTIKIVAFGVGLVQRSLSCWHFWISLCYSFKLKSVPVRLVSIQFLEVMHAVAIRWDKKMNIPVGSVPFGHFLDRFAGLLFFFSSVVQPFWGGVIAPPRPIVSTRAAVYCLFPDWKCSKKLQRKKTITTIQIDYSV